MSLFIATSFLVLTQADPNILPIGAKGDLTIEPGYLVETKSGKQVTLVDFAKACRGKRFVFLGENHATKPHQMMEEAVVRALSDSGLKPTVGVEFFQRPKQDILDLWSTGALTETDFLSQSEWKAQWGYSYDYYRPLFDVIRERKMPVVGLNVPRDWVRKVGKGGFDALPLSAKIQLPADMFLGNTQHRAVFDSLMGGHDMGPSTANIYAAQVLWDEGMADTAAKYLQVRKPANEDVFVVIAGSGHIMYGQGINYRLAKRRAGNGVSLVMLQSPTSVKIARGIADYVYVTTPEKK
jgi:uncharacterized iron-regulated protein